jgi:hypothetical protein
VVVLTHGLAALLGRPPGMPSPRFWTFLHSLYARARLNRNLELSRRINIVRHSRRAEIATLHEVLWMRPRVPPTPPR